MQLKNKLLTAGCIALTAAALVSGVACNDHELSPFSKSLSSGKKQLQDSGSSRQVDILFVIDDSNSMVEEQQSLDANFNFFLEKLQNANANFRLAATSTSYKGTNMPFQTKALESGEKVFANDSSVNVDKVKSVCSKYFGKDRTWIDYFSDENGKTTTTPLDKDVIKDLFRCEAIMGTDGDGIEKGLASMKSALSTARDLNNIADTVKNFKRPGSILAVVFVTDENDCSSLTSYSVDDRAKCEFDRNIEDSCAITNGDRVAQSSDGSSLTLSKGDYIEYNGVKKLFRDWCVAGGDTSRKALEKCLADKSCSSNDFIRCPEGGCTNGLIGRKTYYDFLLNYVITSNEEYYSQMYATKFAEARTASERRELLETSAKSDIIIASIINRDQGIRYDGNLPENWCGVAGSQSYRYQLFAEMFGNAPIYAPICCKNEKFSAGKEIVCSGDAKDNGQNGQFGPVLSAIGQRIGEAVNTICASSAPVTCKPADCNESNGSDGFTDKPRSNPSSSCACLYGCKASEPHFAGTENEYYLCNEFEFSVGAMKGEEYKSYTAGKDFTIDYESSYCKSRTSSPIQVNLLTSEAGYSIVFDYPKSVGN